MSSEVEGEPKERKKIHFAVPSSAPPNLDPRQVEMVRSFVEAPRLNIDNNNILSLFFNGGLRETFPSLRFSGF